MFLTLCEMHRRSGADVRVEPLRPGIRTRKLGKMAASARRAKSWSCGNAYQPGTFQLELEQKHKGLEAEEEAVPSQGAQTRQQQAMALRDRRKSDNTMDRGAWLGPWSSP